MRVTNALNRNAVFAFALFFALMVWAFWPSYFSRLLEQPTYHPHAHGIAMVLWCVLLVAQATLIRSNNRPLHRKLGKFSYLFIPIIVVSTVNFIHFRLQGIPPSQLPVGAFYVLALILNALVVFVVLYGLAMSYRHNPALHSRYMVSTIFPLFTPVTDRLIAAHFQSIAALVPRIGGSPVLPAAGFLLADLILVGLTLWDWQANRRFSAFPVALGLLLVYHFSVLTFYDLAFWQAFCHWFATLPLS